MGDFERGLGRLEELRASIERERAGKPVAPPTLDELAGAAFAPGEPVLDKVTGGKGHVVATRFKRVIFPAPGRD